ncbi:MAG: hypothetical protein KGS72_17420 [Cyanobacteria bacterium REEB67]|nr:hypothetical protein [Cyanobacteria bacterium REEB67]
MGFTSSPDQILQCFFVDTLGGGVTVEEGRFLGIAILTIGAGETAGVITPGGKDGEHQARQLNLSGNKAGVRVTSERIHMQIITQSHPCSPITRYDLFAI